MQFLYNAKSHYNLANLITMGNISFGMIAIYFTTQHNFVLAIALAWLGGICDIFDGKMARKYNLSNEFGVQLDSFADFLSFVLMPTFLIYEAVFDGGSNLILILAGAGSIYYVISGLRRLIQFNIEADPGEAEKFFTGVPTPLGAILLWLVYLAFVYISLPPFGVLILMLGIGYLLNSNVKVPHP
ncbi:MAG TPA: phosphatidylserine synthase [Sulfurimonas sp.]|nr:phosphatidylserine synthase [Sulfurimonas sp.]